MIQKVVLREKKKYTWKEGELQSTAAGTRKWYWQSGDLHTMDGVLKEKDLKTAQGIVRSHKGKEFLVYAANTLDQKKTIIRGPQTLTDKDLGYILIASGVDKNSLVVDAGTGCGLLAATMASLAKRVVSYDIAKENTLLAQKNLAHLGIANVELKTGDVTQGIEERDVDILTLDLPEPWLVNLGCLRHGGTIIVYVPSITQVIEFCKNCKEHVETVCEILQREWHVAGKKVRPKSDMLGHTAFLIVVRKTSSL